MKSPVVFFGALAIAVVALALTIYYAIPGIHHVATFGTHPANEIQPAHIALFGVIAVLCVLAALIARPKAGARR
jgi:hypothetical protein